MVHTGFTGSVGRAGIRRSASMVNPVATGAQVWAAIIAGHTVRAGATPAAV